MFFRMHARSAELVLGKALRLHGVLPSGDGKLVPECGVEIS
jgi:hypothetical protein